VEKGKRLLQKIITPIIFLLFLSIFVKPCLANSPPGQATLSTPADGAYVGELTSNSVTVSFALNSWGECSGGTVNDRLLRVYYGANSSFSTYNNSELLSGNTTSFTIPMSHLRTGVTYYWYVHAQNGCEGIDSVHRSFITSSAPAPTLIPLGGICTTHEQCEGSVEQFWLSGNNYCTGPEGNSKRCRKYFDDISECSRMHTLPGETVLYVNNDEFHGCRTFSSWITFNNDKLCSLATGSDTTNGDFYNCSSRKNECFVSHDASAADGICDQKAVGWNTCDGGKKYECQLDRQIGCKYVKIADTCSTAASPAPTLVPYHNVDQPVAGSTHTGPFPFSGWSGGGGITKVELYMDREKAGPSTVGMYGSELANKPRSDLTGNLAGYNTSGWVFNPASWNNPGGWLTPGQHTLRVYALKADGTLAGASPNPIVRTFTIAAGPTATSTPSSGCSCNYFWRQLISDTSEDRCKNGITPQGCYAVGTTGMNAKITWDSTTSQCFHNYYACSFSNNLPEVKNCEGCTLTKANNQVNVTSRSECLGRNDALAACRVDFLSSNKGLGNAKFRWTADNKCMVDLYTCSPAGSCPVCASGPAREAGNGNCDGFVNRADLALWVNAFTRSVYSNSLDFNCDGAVNRADLASWISGFANPNIPH